MDDQFVGERVEQVLLFKSQFRFGESLEEGTDFAMLCTQEICGCELVCFIVRHGFSFGGSAAAGKSWIAADKRKVSNHGAMPAFQGCRGRNRRFVVSRALPKRM
ncbi:MAG TPA: hypothetical protein VGG33_18595 [Polyangia bacterium]